MKECKRKHCTIVMKGIVLILLLLSVSLMYVGVLTTACMCGIGIYSEDAEEIKDTWKKEQMSEVAMAILKKHVKGSPNEARRYAQSFNCNYVVKKNGTIVGGANVKDFSWSAEYVFGEYESGRYVFYGVNDYSIRLFMEKQAMPNTVSWSFFIVDNCEWLRILVPIVILIGAVMALLSFCVLVKKIGWCPQSETVTSGRFGKIPTDLFTLICVGLGVLWYFMTTVWWLTEYAYIRRFLWFHGLTFLLVIWCLSIIARKKAKTIFSNMFSMACLKKLKKWLPLLVAVVAKLPLMWKSVCVLALTCLLEGIVLFSCINLWYTDISKVLLAVMWSLEKVILFPAVLFLVMRLQDLKQAGKALAEGNLDYKVDEEKFFFDLKEHAANLNRISEGVNIAVQERMKSEHFKTELITNVSHDIKTPLTSIINYSDLLSKEETDNEKIKEYAQVLQRQSGKLKKLIEDLVEASKASTGSIEVQMEECEVEVLLEQAVGEFEGKLYEKNIDVITKVPPVPTKIMADGRLLWRVFDNLLNNICKYTQSGTRVYLTVENKEGKAVVTLKNISEYPLDITEEELMERFVRGDKSRHTEGNGLGLNIAKSLVELQNGTMELAIDGDLFKVILQFALIS